MGRMAAAGGAASGHARRVMSCSDPDRADEPSVNAAAAAGSGVGDTVERLVAEFGDGVDRAVVSAAVRRCRVELAGISTGALPDLLERLARERLREQRLHGAAASTTASSTGARSPLLTPARRLHPGWPAG